MMQIKKIRLSIILLKRAKKQPTPSNLMGNESQKTDKNLVAALSEWTAFSRKFKENVMNCAGRIDIVS